MKTRWLAVSLTCLAIAAYAQAPIDLTQTVDGTQLDVQSLTTGVTSGKVTAKSVRAVATISGDQTVPPPAHDFVPMTFRPSSSLAPAEQTTTATTDSATTTSPDVSAVPTSGGDAGSNGSGGVALPGTPAVAGPTRVAPLVYEVAERRPDFVYRPGRLDFQPQPTYDSSQNGLAVGPGVRPGTTRFVPVGSF